ITPIEQRGWLSGLAIGVQLVSSVAFLLVIFFATGGSSAVPIWAYALVAAVLIASFGLTVGGIRETRELAHEAHEQQRLPLRAYVDALLEQQQAMRYLGTLFVYQFGLNAIIPY